MEIYVPDIHYIKNISVKEQEFVVPAASGGPHFNKSVEHQK